MALRASARKPGSSPSGPPMTRPSVATPASRTLPSCAAKSAARQVFAGLVAGDESGRRAQGGAKRLGLFKLAILRPLGAAFVKFPHFDGRKANAAARRGGAADVTLDKFALRARAGTSDGEQNQTHRSLKPVEERSANPTPRSGQPRTGNTNKTWVAIRPGVRLAGRVPTSFPGCRTGALPAGTDGRRHLPRPRAPSRNLPIPRRAAPRHPIP